VTSLALDRTEKVINKVKGSINVVKKIKCDRIMLLSDVLESDGSVEVNSISSKEKLECLSGNF